MPTSFTALNTKEQIFNEIKSRLENNNFQIDQFDFSRPWGGFFVIDEDQVEKFIVKYFPKIKISDLKITSKLSPKILVVGPGKRLSWQYHDRRAEIWRVEAGSVGVITSDTDEEGKIQILKPGDLIKLRQGERHRLVGLDGWGVVAEIWQHTDTENPSDESDIYRLQDDFGR
ncbi:MAG: phosphoheptose isomerase [Bacteroidota bacterium]